MAGARVIKLATASLLAALCGCGLASHRPQPAPASHRVPIDRPIALATLDAHLVVGSHGRIMGYIPGWPFPGPEPTDEVGDAMFTYVVDFTIVETPAFPRLGTYSVNASGVRRIYFHRDGVRIAFGDPDRFVRGDPITTDRVSFAIVFRQDRRDVDVRGLLHRVSAHSFDYGGYTITPPETDDGSFELLGRPAPQYSSPRRYFGILLTST